MDSKQIRAAQKAFGKAVREYRLRAGLSQEKLAALAGVHRNYVGDVERAEENISLINMLKLADALGVSLNALFRDVGK